MGGGRRRSWSAWWFLLLLGGLLASLVGGHPVGLTAAPPCSVWCLSVSTGRLPQCPMGPSCTVGSPAEQRTRPGVWDGWLTCAGQLASRPPACLCTLPALQHSSACLCMLLDAHWAWRLPLLLPRLLLLTSLQARAPCLRILKKLEYSKHFQIILHNLGRSKRF